MEQDRKLRLLIPPFLLLASLLLGAVMDPEVDPLAVLRDLATQAALPQLLAAMFAGGVAVIAAGFMISSLMIFFMRFFFIRTPWCYEAKIPDAALEQVCRLIGFQKPVQPEHLMFAVETYNWALPEGLRGWLSRRWNMFMVSVNSSLGLFGAHLVGKLIGVSQHWQWWLMTLFFLAVLIANAWVARAQMIEMIKFLPYCNLEGLPGTELCKADVAKDDDDH